MSETVGRLSIGEGRILLRALRDLGDVKAPAGLAGAVLAGAGLADAYWEMESPIGPVFVAYSGRGISAVARAEDGQAFERAFLARLGRPVYRVARPPTGLAGRVADELNGGRARLSYDLQALTEFQRAVLLKALEIPRGEVRSYSWIAREIDRPAAVRAVGSALANNPIPLLIPCHRVVRTDGRIGDYAFGSDAKRAMLRFEGVEPEGLERLAVAGVRYLGSDTTRVFCLPTCRHARRVSGRHLVRFDSLASAMSAGYRPCRVCRPA